MLKGVELARRGREGEVLLDGVSLILEPGDRLALVGPSGAGKSLLLRALVLLDPLAGGYVEWRGERPTAAAVPPFRREVLFLQQAPAIGEEVVERQLALPWSFRSARGRSFHRDAALRLLAGVGRDESLLSLAGSKLSGGEAQLVALVRALLIGPRILLLDEPTSAMDPDTRAGAEQLLVEWRKAEPGRGWIWVSHDPAQLARMCDRRLELRDGRVLS